ncbi:MAG: hypothetical protein HRT86_05580 [Ilumatobacteraceae bacterium]|nr:hypothetical protein [Ilumatobacteraceae bacterium]
MANGTYYYPTNIPAPKNTGGLNAFQLSVQKTIQQNNASWNTRINELKQFQNAPKFSTHVEDFWNEQIGLFAGAQTGVMKGTSSVSDAQNEQAKIEKIWGTWTQAAPYIASLGEVVKEYNLSGYSDKLNNPNLEALFSAMQRNDGSVTLNRVGDKLVLSGSGEMERLDSNGNGTGEMMPWAYDLDLEQFLTSIGVGTYEGTEEKIMDNLNKIIRKRWTKDDIGMEPIVNAAIKTYPGIQLDYKIPIMKDGQETDATTQISFINQDFLKYALNNGGSNSGGDDPSRGAPMWLGTEEHTAFMDNENFDSYYANVLYQDYQPYYNESGEVEWLIDYDDNGNEIERVKPWNMSDSSVFIPARDKLTSMALESTNLMPSNLMLKIKDEYKELIDTTYNGNLGDFLKDAQFSDFGANPYKYMEGTNAATQDFWTKATEYAAEQSGVDEEVIDDTDDPPPSNQPVRGSMQKVALEIDKALSLQAGWDAYNMTELIENMNKVGVHFKDYGDVNKDGVVNEEDLVPVTDFLQSLKVGEEGISVSIKPVGKTSKKFSIIVKPTSGKFSDELVPQFDGWYGNNNARGYGKNIDIPGDAPTNRKANEIWNLLLKELNKIGVNVEGKREI